MQESYMEDLCIVGVGTFMHLTRLGPFTASRAVDVEIVPNAASTLLAVTLLAALTKWRPIRGEASAMGRAQRLLRLVVELTIIVCMVEFLLVWLWIPLLELLSGVCEWVTAGYFERHLPRLADWLNNGFFYVLRLLLAVILATGIAVSQGWLECIGVCCSSTNQLGETGSVNTFPVRGYQSLPSRVPSSRPIVVRYSEGSTRNRNLPPCAIRSVTLHDSTA